MTTPIGQPFNPKLSSELFRDTELRAKVLVGIETRILPENSQKRAVKRSAISKESSTLPRIMKRLCEILDVPATRSLKSVEDKLL